MMTPRRPVLPSVLLRSPRVRSPMSLVPEEEMAVFPPPSGRYSPGMSTTGWALFGILSAVLPSLLIGLLLLDEARGGFQLLSLPLAVVFYTSWRLSVDFAAKKYDYVRQYLYVYLYVNFGIAPIIQLAMQQFPWLGDYSNGEIVYAYLILALGLGAFEFASRGQAGRPKHVRKLSVWQGERMPWIVILAAIVLGLVGPVLFVALGWEKVVFQTRMEMGETMSNQLGSSVLFQLAIKTMYCLPLFGGIVLLLTSGRMRGQWRYLQIGLAAGFLGFALLVGNPLSAARYWFATVCLSIVATIIQCYFPRMLRLLPIALVFAYLLIYPIASIYRDVYSYNKFQQSRNYEWIENYRSAFLTGDFDSLQQVMNTVRVAESNGNQWGYQMLGTLLFWVPRTVWPEKPLSTGEMVAHHVGYSFTNLSCPLWAEGYMDFHLLGTLVFLAAYGVIWRRLREKMDSVAHGATLTITLVLIFAPYSVFLLRGGLMSALAYITPALGMYALLLGASKLAPRPRPDGSRGSIL